MDNLNKKDMDKDKDTSQELVNESSGKGKKGIIKKDYTLWVFLAVLALLGILIYATV